MSGSLKLSGKVTMKWELGSLTILSSIMPTILRLKEYRVLVALSNII